MDRASKHRSRHTRKRSRRTDSSSLSSSSSSLSSSRDDSSSSFSSTRSHRHRRHRSRCRRGRAPSRHRRRRRRSSSRSTTTSSSSSSTSSSPSASTAHVGPPTPLPTTSFGVAWRSGEEEEVCLLAEPRAVMEADDLVQRAPPPAPPVKIVVEAGDVPRWTRMEEEVCSAPVATEHTKICMEEPFRISTDAAALRRVRPVWANLHGSSSTDGVSATTSSSMNGAASSASSPPPQDDVLEAEKEPPHYARAVLAVADEASDAFRRHFERGLVHPKPPWFLCSAIDDNLEHPYYLGWMDRLPRYASLDEVLQACARPVEEKGPSG